MIKMIKRIMPQSIKRNLRKVITETRVKPMYKKMTTEKITKSDKKRFILIGAPNYKNLGDHAIVEAEEQFLAHYFSDIEYIEFSMLHYLYDAEHISQYIDENDVVLVHGGGFLGNLWLDAENMVRQVLTDFPNNKVIVFPQTMHYDSRFNKDEELKKSQLVYNKHKDLTVFLRERQSYEFVKDNFAESVNPKLVPDIVAFLEYKSSNSNRQDVLMAFRDDKEKLNHSKYTKLIEEVIKSKNIKLNYTDTVITDHVDESNRDIKLKEKFEQFNRHKLIVTDRLHGMIFSLITGTPCIAFDNSSGKVSGVFEWLKDFEYIYCIENDKEYTSEDFNEIVDRLLNYKDYGYNKELILDTFEPLIEELNKIKN